MRFATDTRQQVPELMTKDNSRHGARRRGQDEAKRLLHQHRIEKILVVDDAYRCVGLITVKDIEKAQKYPNACKDERGRLRVAAATSVGEDGYARAMALIEAERRSSSSIPRMAIPRACSTPSPASSGSRTRCKWRPAMSRPPTAPGR